MPRFLSADIGGTHTDLIYIDTDAGEVRVAKVPTTAQNQADGLLNGIGDMDVAPSGIDLIIHGTTVATNAVIERKGAKCGLITTEGFRDILELRRRDRPHVFGLTGEFAPLIPRQLRREVRERISAEGEVLTPIDLEALRDVARSLLADGCEVLILAFINAYANPVHEEAARDALAEVWPNEYIVLSSFVLPAIREFERTSTTVISGYVQPLLSRYFNALITRLEQGGYARDLLIVQSNGGLMRAAIAPKLAANTILSGPAGGVTAAVDIARDCGIENVVSADMGGTSLDICVIRKGQPPLTQSAMLEFGIPLATPMLAIDAVGVGGGSIAGIDATGLLTVGPRSVGSDPGPACYGKGTLATITDALLVTGILDPASAIDHKRGRVMDPGLSAAAIEATIGKPLALDAVAGADAILTVAHHKSAGYLRRRLVEQGHDPRNFSVLGFGGAGPLFANAMVRNVGLKSAIIPYFPGITSALGCLLGRLRHDFVRTVNMTLGAFDGEALARVYGHYDDEGRKMLLAEGVTADRIETRLGADMCYKGQTHSIQVHFPGDIALSADSLRAAFEAAYTERFSSKLDQAEILLVNARLSVVSTLDPPSLSDLLLKRAPATPAAPRGSRRIHLGGQWMEAAIYDRFSLAVGQIVSGPAILAQPDATTLVEPGFQARVHESLNIIIETIQ